MSLVQSFEPVIGDSPRVLILGSMPGIASLEAAQYYAHPRNIFWKIMQELFCIGHLDEYEDRVRQIKKKPIVLWDSLRHCARQGSLDSSIDGKTVEGNNINALLEEHRSIQAIVFNGAASEKYFKKLVLPTLIRSEALTFLKMPSTSPANAGMSYDKKLACWKQILDYI